MKCAIRRIIVSVTLVVLLGMAKGQSTVGAVATATIVTPLTVRSNSDIGLEMVSLPSTRMYPLSLNRGGNSLNKFYLISSLAADTLQAADFTLNGLAEEVYYLDIPEKLLLVHTNGLEKMTAKPFTRAVSGCGIMQDGKQSIITHAALYVEMGQMPGRYHSQNFLITANFN